jgi:sirohydrochlorin cobaltochelatase
MKKWIAVFAGLLASMMLFSCSKTEAGGKKALLVVSFGTSYPETRALTIDAIEKDLGASFEGWEVKRAFTSSIIRDVIKEKEGTEIPGPSEMLDQLSADGYTNVLVQPTHILQGAEYHELLEDVEEKRTLFEHFKIGAPLLSDEEDYARTAEALAGQFREGETIVLMGHGNEHHPEYNIAYFKLQEIFDEKKMPVHIGVVEGTPDLDSVLERLKMSGAGEVTLMPFMIVAGDHANNDMASDEEDSWKTVLAVAGIDSRVYLHGIGENERIRKIYIEHAKDAL